MNYLYLKALHIIFVVTWFSGLFYIVRLFIYDVEANQKKEPERSFLISQLQLMQKRLWYGITWPSAVLVWIFGLLLLITNWSFIHMPWFHVKLILVLLLSLYHGLCGIILKQLKNNIYRYSSTQLRLWNELATVFLVAIVFLVELQDALNWLWAILGLLIVSILLLYGVYLYKKIRR